MSFIQLYEQLFSLFLIVSIGIVAVKAKILTSESTKVLSGLLINFTFPATILAYANTSSGSNNLSYIFISFFSIILFFILCAIVCEILAKALKMQKEDKAVFAMFSILPNSLFVGMPIVVSIYGDVGALCALGSAVAYNVMFFTYGANLFKKNNKFDIKVFLTPGNVATLVMILLLLTNIKLPFVLNRSFEVIGGATTPLALVIIGIMIGSSDVLKIFKTKFLYLITLLRCFIFPLIFAVILSFTPIDNTIAHVLVLLLSCAAGTLGAVLARVTNVKPELASMAVTHTTVFLAVSLPIVALISQSILF